MAADLDDLIAYLDASPSPWHAVASTTARLGGFTHLAEHDDWSDVPTKGLVVRDGAVIAWSIPERRVGVDRVPHRRRPHGLTRAAGQAPT